MNKRDLIALDDAGIELTSPAGSAAHAPAPRMSALERMKMMVDEPERYLAFARGEAMRLDARVKRVHDSHGCDIWETWIEKDVPLAGGGRADCKFVGCRKCRVSILLADDEVAIENEKQVEEVKCRSCGHVDCPAWCDERGGYRVTHEVDCNYVIFEDDCDCAASEHVEARA